MSDPHDDDADGPTLWAGRLRPWPAPDDQTVLSSRPRAAGEPASDAEPEDRTVLSSRPRPATEPASDAQPEDRTVLSSRPRGGPRRSSEPEGEVDADAPTDGSTVVARRESRRRAARLPDATEARAPLAPTSAADLPQTIGRVARVPDGGGEIYRPRASGPVIAARQEPAPRAPQSPVDTEAAGRRRRRSRRRALTALVIALLVGAVALAATLVILFVF